MLFQLVCAAEIALVCAVLSKSIKEPMVGRAGLEILGSLILGAMIGAIAGAVCAV